MFVNGQRQTTDFIKYADVTSQAKKTVTCKQEEKDRQTDRKVNIQTGRQAD
jgi:hypothetical protein